MILRKAHPLLLVLTALSMIGCGDNGGPAPKSMDEYTVLNSAPRPLPADVPAEGMIIMEMIEVEAGAFSDWSLANSLNPSQATGLRRQVQEWIHSEQGRVVETSAVHCRSGQRAETKSVREVIYPTEYKYPVIERPVKDDDDDEKKETPPKVTQKVIAGVAPAPRVFETREVGTVLKADMVIDAATGVIELTLAPELVRYFEDIEWEARVGADEEKFGVPLFERSTITTSISLQDSTYGFLGSGRLPEQAQSDEINDSVLLVFVRVDTNFSTPL